MLMSATTSADVDRLRELMLHSAVDVAVTAAAGDPRANAASGTAAEIEHYRVDCPRCPRNRHSCRVHELDRCAVGARGAERQHWTLLGQQQPEH